MMSNKPAFPLTGTTTETRNLGMTMRQYYKAAALSGELAGQYLNFPWKDHDDLANRCANIADAMIAEDEKYGAG